MLKGMLASNASKLVAACVCPVAGSVALTVGVPQVRDTVHRATAPRAYALPKTRVRKPRPVEQVATPVPVQTAALSAPPCEPSLNAGAPLSAQYTPVTEDETQLANIGDLPGRPGWSGVPDGGVNLPAIPGVPEPHTWVQMLIGFGLIGGAARYSLKNGGVDVDVVQPDQA